MTIKLPDPKASQKHKPLEKFVSDIVNDLNSAYIPVQKYCSKRKVLIPWNDDDTESCKDVLSQIGKTEEPSEEEGDYTPTEGPMQKMKTFRVNKRKIKVYGEDG